MARYLNHLNLYFRLSACLPDLDAKDMATISCHNKKNTHWWHVPFLVPTSICLLLFAFPFVFIYMIVYLMQRNHTKELMFHIDIFLRGVCLDTTKLFEVFKVL